MNKMMNKLLASMLVITLTFANLMLLGTYATESWAAATELERQETRIKDKVDFDVYFLNEKGGKSHTKTIDIHSQEEKMYITIEALQGYLRNAKIELVDTNFQMQDVSDQYEVIQEMSDNTITLNQMESGNKVVLEIPIKISKNDTIHLDNFTKQNQIKITGSSIDNRAKTTTIEHTIITNLNLHGQADLRIEQEITKFTPYQVGSNAGFMLQTVVKSGIENATLPIEQTNMKVQVPTLKDGTKPSKINVSANSLEATKADKEGLEFNASNWSYEENTGIVSILVENKKDEKNMVRWGKEGLDELVITYIFENAAIPTELPVHLKTDLTIKAYNNEITQVQKTEEKEVVLQEKLGDIVTFEVATIQETLGKGFLYENHHYETEYQTKWIADLGYVDLIDQITMKQNQEAFLNSNGNIYETTRNGKNEAYYQSTSISKDNFTKILGSDENAYIHIYDTATNTLIATINKDTIADENGNMVVSYGLDTNHIYLQTSKPIKEGKLEIQHTKKIKATTDYTQEELKSFCTLKTGFIGTILNESTKIAELEASKEIGLTEPSTKVEALVNNAKDVNLSTIVENNNVEFKVILQNTDITANLFKNPTIELVFPSNIEQMKITNLNLLFDEELQIDQNNIQTYKKEDERIALKIPIKGEQSIYNFNQTQNGTNIVMNADITVKQLTPSIETTIEAYVTNENATGYQQEKEGRAYQELKANFVAPTGMVTVNSMSAYSEKGETVTSLTGKEEVGEIATQASKQNGKVTLTIMNNYDATCKNVSILGKIPFKGNKSLASGEDLGSTFTAKIISGIVAEYGIDEKEISVYYTKNENATNVLEDPANGWTTQISELREIKSYLIVLNNYEMEKGQTLVFSYNVEIPENLQHNESAYGMYGVIFDQVTEEQSIQSTSISSKVGVSTMEGINLETKMYNNVENESTVQEGQIIKYTVEVTNTGNNDANNLKVTSMVPEGTIYVVYVPENMGENGEPEYAPARYIEHSEITMYETTIDTIKAGETKTISYEVKADSLNGDTNKIASTSATIQSEEYGETFTTNTVENTIEKGYFNISFKANLEEGIEIIRQNEKLFYEIVISNVNNETKNNLQLKMKIPEGITYGATYLYDSQENVYNKTDNIVEYKEEDRTLIIHINKLEQEEIKLGIGITTDKLAQNEMSKTISINLEASCNETTNILKSNTVSYQVANSNIVITQTSDIAEGTIAEKEELNYIIEVTNHGLIREDDINFTDELPEGVTCVKTQYEKSGIVNTLESNLDTISRILALDPEETARITITVKTNELNRDSTEKQIVNIAKITTTGSGEIKSNSVTHTIDSKATPSDESEGNTDARYKISGTVWLDENEDGTKDDQEPKLGNIEVMLINTEKNTVVNQTTTDSLGKYTFTDLEKGKYMVAFIYDSTLYTITEYQKTGVNESRNSDAIEKSIIADNQSVIGAITDDISITNANAYYMDLGLIARNKFDFSLNKSIQNITVKTTAGTKNYNYNENTTLAKVDIAPKRIEGTNVVIQYKFTVRNEGNIAGYVNKIVDYLPSELKFSSSMNPDWYQAENGSIYNATLSNDRINPGETREVTLTLTKTMTGESTGIINNAAEIYEAYNELGLVDINSTPGNKAQGENDMGSADVLLTVNTGEPVMYITITIMMIAVLAAGAYIINKKVLKRM